MDRCGAKLESATSPEYHYQLMLGMKLIAAFSAASALTPASPRIHRQHTLKALHRLSEEQRHDLTDNKKGRIVRPALSKLLR